MSAYVILKHLHETQEAHVEAVRRGHVNRAAGLKAQIRCYVRCFSAHPGGQTLDTGRLVAVSGGPWSRTSETRTYEGGRWVVDDGKGMHAWCVKEGAYVTWHIETAGTKEHHRRKEGETWPPVQEHVAKLDDVVNAYEREVKRL